MINKNIFLLWLQGWNKAPWLQRKVLESWTINNPDWNIKLIDQNNLLDYVNDIDYIFDKNKKITFQAKSDIIRLSLLENYGGIWADSTLLCMQPLSHWVFDAVSESGIWMYHGHGAYLKSDLGPASWFIVSEKKGYLISKWKRACDSYWTKNNKAKDYFWMDQLFRVLLEKEVKFKHKWLKTPFLYCEDIGSSHTLANYNFGIQNNTKIVKEIFQTKPPYVLKLSSNFKNIFPNLNSKKFKNSNAFLAISNSTRKLIYKHNFIEPISVSSPMKKNLILRLFFKIKRKLKTSIIPKI